MAQQEELQISPRAVTGKATKRLRKAGIIPANIFGHKQESQTVQVEALAFQAPRRANRTKSVLSLRMPGRGNVQTVLIRHIQRDPRTGKILHIDFFRVSLTDRIPIKVPLLLVGEAPAVRIENGVLLHLLDALEGECAAQDIVDHFDVDVSSLTEIDGIIHARDIQLPPNYTLVTAPDEGVVKVAATRAQLAAEAAVTEAAAAPVAPAAPEATGAARSEQ